MKLEHVTEIGGQFHSTLLDSVLNLFGLLGRRGFQGRSASQSMKVAVNCGFAAFRVERLCLSVNPEKTPEATTYEALPPSVLKGCAFPFGPFFFEATPPALFCSSG
jgi:hypothetical protein